MSDITREQYDNAVRIRENGYRCHDTPMGPVGCNSCGRPRDCGSYVSGISSEKEIRRNWINNRISTYEAEHPEEFRKPPRIYDYRDVGLDEVQALIGQEVYVSDYIFTMLTDQKPCHSELASCEVMRRPFVDSSGFRWQFIRAIDEPPKIRLTRAELIAIAAKSRGVKPEQIVVEE